MPTRNCGSMELESWMKASCLNHETPRLFSREKFKEIQHFQLKFCSLLLKLFSGNSASFKSKLLSFMSKSYDKVDIEKLSDKLFHSL